MRIARADLDLDVVRLPVAVVEPCRAEMVNPEHRHYSFATRLAGDEAEDTVLVLQYVRMTTAIPRYRVENQDPWPPRPGSLHFLDIVYSFSQNHLM